MHGLQQILILTLFMILPVDPAVICRNRCGSIAVNYPFGVDDGCGAPQFRKMLACNATDLFFTTPNGNYKVQAIDYEERTMVVYDPDMSTCAILQPHHDLVMTEIQYAIIPPSPDTVFALLNCSIDSPVLNHYRSLCFNFSGHSCDELYTACNSFKIFHLLTNSSPPCCFTDYNTVKFMSMNILDCTHYTSVYDTDNLKGVGPMDWSYGIKFSFSIPDTGCNRCTRSGGSCGFDSETEGLLCLCSSSTNSTRECGHVNLTIPHKSGSSNDHVITITPLESSFILDIRCFSQLQGVLSVRESVGLHHPSLKCSLWHWNCFFL